MPEPKPKPAGRNPPARRRPTVVVTLDPETIGLIDARAAELAGTAVPSRSKAIDDLVRIATAALEAGRAK